MIDVFTSIEQLKADRIPREYSKTEHINQIKAARAINKIRIENEKKDYKQQS